MTEEKDIPRFCNICLLAESDWKIKGTPFYVCEDCKKKHIEKSVELILIHALK